MQNPDQPRYADSEEENQQIINRAAQYLSHFGLTLESIRDKNKVLDLGAFDSTLEKGARAAGITNVISLDKHLAHLPSDKSLEGKLVANAIQLPFPDNSIDIIISRSGPIHLTPYPEIAKAELAEAYRVLSPQGLVLLSPGQFKFILNKYRDAETINYETRRKENPASISKQDKQIYSDKIHYIMDTFGAQIYKESNEHLQSLGYNFKVDYNPYKMPYWIIEKSAL